MTLPCPCPGAGGLWNKGPCRCAMARLNVTEWLHGLGYDEEFTGGSDIEFANRLRDLIAPQQNWTPFADEVWAVDYFGYVCNLLNWSTGKEVARRISRIPQADECVPASVIEVPKPVLNFPKPMPKILALNASIENRPPIVPAPSEEEIERFYRSRQWKRLRYRHIKDKRQRCQCCGRTPERDGVPVVVDHRWPVRFHWDLRLDPSNLQLLCDECNVGKGSDDTTDWRRPNSTTHHHRRNHYVTQV
jgi:5-methylcytosine-specific restriction endonuclease McrA